MKHPIEGKPKRIQRKRTKGWKMPPNTVYVGRGSKWGNPYVIGEKFHNTIIDAQWAVRLYESAIKSRSMALPFVIENAVKELRGKNLACWCKEGEPCHADVLIEIANQH